METALYCPNYGFYEREKDTIGRAGDFYTSVSVGPLFGELLAFQFAEWFGEWEISREFTEIARRRGNGRLGPRKNSKNLRKWEIVEAGAHDGQLARDILVSLQKHRSELFDQLEYLIIEPSKRRRATQAKTLSEFSDRVRWIPNLRKTTRIDGIIFSNELLDAMPVHRVRWDARRRK